MPQYAGDLDQSAPSASAIRNLQVPTIVDRDRLSTNSIVRVNGRCFVDDTGLLYEWNGTIWLIVPEESPELQVATQADKATIPVGQLTAGDLWTVTADGRHSAAMRHEALRRPLCPRPL